MKLAAIKNQLSALQDLQFQLPDGTFVPEHFHVTEVGIVAKHFIDCGGTVRHETVANFQLWNANDTSHRLKPQKLLNIIALSENILGMEDLEVEVEYQCDTIGKYGIDFNGKNFLLTSKHTACLASDACGAPDKQRLQLIESGETKQACCNSGKGCC